MTTISIMRYFNLSPWSGPIGAVVTLFGHGFPASTAGSFTFDGEPAPFSVTTDTTGAFTRTVTRTFGTGGG